MTFPAAHGDLHRLVRIAPGEAKRLCDEGITYDSRGVVLVVGAASVAAAAAARLATNLRVIACLSGEVPTSSPRANPLVMEGRIAALTGHLGSFRASAHGKAGSKIDLAPFSPNADGAFDLVLDLSREPLLTAALKPPGYFAPGEDALAVTAAIDQMPGLVGRFRKPVHVRYDEGLCVHEAQGVAGCARCLAACPAQAIASRGDRIAVDANLCHGCATCMLVCPSGALGAGEATGITLISRLAQMAASSGRRDGLLLHVAGDDPANESLTAIALPSIAAAGIETWLAALALGYPQVTLQFPEDLPASTQRALAGEIDAARAWLAAIGMDSGRIRTSADAHAEFAALAAPPLNAAANKRELVNDALTALAGKAANGVTALTDAPCALPGAAFGSVEVDRESCTACLACAPLCPTGALRGDNPAGGSVALKFVEALCVQCGICANVCPEKALKLRARFARGDRQAARVLIESAQHCCPDCGKAFISRALLEKSLEFMRERMAGDAADNLCYCPACRMARVQRC
jgi:ferredoxin